MKESLPGITECIAIVDAYRAEHGVYPKMVFYADSARKIESPVECRALVRVMQYALQKRGDDPEVEAFLVRYRGDKDARDRVAQAREPRNIDELRVEARKIERRSAPVYQEPTPTQVDVKPDKPSKRTVKTLYQVSLNQAIKLLGEDTEAIVQVSTGDALTSVRLYVTGARDLCDQVGILLGGMVPRIYDVKVK